MYKIFLLIFILIFQQYYSYNYSYITFDLKKYINNSLNYDDPSDLINYDLYSFYSTELIFGTPEKKYTTQISLDNYGFDLAKYKCDIETNLTDDEYFNPYYSNSSLVEISGLNFTYYGLNDIYRITDHITLYQNNTLNIFFPNIIFYYDPRNISIAKYKQDFSPFTCFKLGLRLPSENLNQYKDYDINIIGQFYRKKIINSYEWFIEYNNDLNPKLIIGVEPFIYDKNKYSYNNSKKIEGKSIYLIGGDYYWKIEFTQIYFLINQKRELIDFRKASLEPSFNFIKGPMDYFKFINETFFNNFFEQNKCFIGNYRISTNIYSLYYCENKEEIKKELKKNFININLLHRFLEKEFVLNYDDLFLEKNNKIYFLIIFDTSVRNNWIFGKPFLKKYFFSFNYDQKILTFYETNNNEENKDDDDKDKYYKWILIIIIIILVIIFTTIGFFLAKYIYNYKKRKATELNNEYNEDDYNKNKEYKDNINIEPILDNNEN